MRPKICEHAGQFTKDVPLRKGAWTGPVSGQVEVSGLGLAGTKTMRWSTVPDRVRTLFVTPDPSLGDRLG